MCDIIQNMYKPENTVLINKLSNFHIKKKLKMPK